MSLEAKLERAITEAENYRFHTPATTIRKWELKAINEIVKWLNRRL